MRLLPCPNPECGEKHNLSIGQLDQSEAESLTEQDSYGVCHTCGLMGPVADTPEEAARMWNGLPRKEPS